MVQSSTVYGWDFVARVGGHTMIRPMGEDVWQHVEQGFIRATRKARYYGQVELVRREPLPCHAYLLKRKAKGRIRRNRFGDKCMMAHSLKKAHRERTPWLLVTSLEGGQPKAKQIIRLYQTRM